MSKSRDHAGLQNLDHLSVAAGSAGNISRFAMSTTIATATYYAKLATIAFPATNNVAANLTLLLTPKSAAGAYAPVLVTVTALQGTSGLSSSSKVQVLSSDGAAIAHDDFFLVTATATNGTDVELWMQSIIAAAYDVQVLAESFDTGVSVTTYNNGATWQSAAPTGAVTVTSDWAGAGTYTPAFVYGSFTYTTQQGEYIEHNGLITVAGRVIWSSFSGTGTLRITLPRAASVSGSGARFTGSFGYIAGVDNGGNRQLVCHVDPSASYLAIRLVADNATPDAAQVANLSTSGEIQFSITYRV